MKGKEKQNCVCITIRIKFTTYTQTIITLPSVGSMLSSVFRVMKEGVKYLECRLLNLGNEDQIYYSKYLFADL